MFDDFKLKIIKNFINNFPKEIFIFNQKKELIFLNKKANNKFNFNIKNNINNQIFKFLLENISENYKLSDFIEQLLSNKINTITLNNFFCEDIVITIKTFKYQNYYYVIFDNLKEEKKQTKNILEIFPLPVFIKNKEGIYINCNKKFLNFVNLKEKTEILGKRIEVLEENKELANFYEQRDYDFIMKFEKDFNKNKQLDITKYKKIYDYQFDYKGKKGIGTLYKNIYIKNNEIQGIIGIIINKTEEKQIENLLKAKNYDLLLQLQIDHLTQIKNRFAFDVILKDKITNYQRYKNNHTVILYILDIDFFKKINDTYGHDIGDIVLYKLSKLISDTIRNSDAFFRIGGEEFAIITNGIEIEDAEIFINKIINKIRKYKINEINKNITVSIGIAKLNFINKDINITKKLLYRNADKALYEAKKNGRNQFRIYKDNNDIQ